MTESVAKKTRTKLPIVGGIIELALAFVCMFFGILMTYVWIINRSITDVQAISHPQLVIAMGIFGLAAFAFGGAGGILAFKRRYFRFALSGTVIILAWNLYGLSFGLIVRSIQSLIFVIPCIFSIISLAFIMASWKEFA